MRKFIGLILSLCILVACNDTKLSTANFEIIPLPNKIEKKDGKGFILSENTKIVYPAENEKLKKTASFLADYVKISTGMSLQLTDQAQDNAIVLNSGYDGGNPESYQLIIDSKNITINGQSEAGTFYGVQTLRKSLPVGDSKKVELPSILIEDYPNFSYRGVMLDVSRHMFPVEFVKKYIDLLALHNINRFHWHITDDQGWRIEIKKYPKLTEVGSKRKETVIGRNTGKFDGKPHGGFYTQEEAKEIVAYAADRFITIIPEIDLPGHMLAALTSYPELGCTGGPYEVGNQWGVFDDVLCVGNEQTFTFLEDVYSELLDIFPSEYIHIGGDECPKVRWEKCPKCQARIKAEGLKKDDKHTAEERLQSYCISRMEKFLNSKGRRIIGWDEILEGGLAPNATVMSWRGIQGGIQAAKQKHDVIMTPSSHLYFDYYQSLDTENEPLAIGGFSDVKNVYNFNPIPSDLTGDEQKYIIGVQANLWTEYISDSKHIEYMLLPRLAALSEVQWTQPSKKDYTSFLKRLFVLTRLYDQLDVNYARNIFGINEDSKVDTEKGVKIITLSTLDDADIYYTLDGSDPVVLSPSVSPSSTSQKYNSPIEINSDVQLNAVALRGQNVSKPYKEDISVNKATFKPITLTYALNKSYTYSVPTILVDGRKGSDNYRSGTWIGVYDNDMEAIVDLKMIDKISKVSIGNFVNTGDWIFGATNFSVSISNDGKEYKEVYSKKIPIDTANRIGIDHFVADFDAQETRFVKINLKVNKSIPDWHQGKGKASFIFVDEIFIGQ